MHTPSALFRGYATAGSLKIRFHGGLPTLPTSGPAGKPPRFFEDESGFAGAFSSDSTLAR
jgi:hypothetical protein